ncbi:MAG: hypothetical protein PVH19_07090 [Planctomycetia bacterium]|jgi:hypothetical protein
MKTTASFFVLALVFCFAIPCPAESVDDAIQTIRQIQPNGEGSTAATAAWKSLTEAEPSELPQILKGMKDANPIISNWLAMAADVVFQKASKNSKPLPVDQLEALVLDPSQSGQARVLAYDWLCRVDLNYRKRLMPKLLGDPCSNLCQRAVQLSIEEVEALEKSGADETEVVAAYQKTLKNTRDPDQIRNLAQRLKKFGQKVDMAAQLGFIADWQIVGPFDGSGDDGFQKTHPPEKQKTFTYKETYEGKPAPDDETKKPRKLQWIKYHTGHPSGHVDLNKVLAKEKGVTAYVATEFLSDRDQDVELRISSHNALEIWVNGKSVGTFEFYHSGGQFDLYRVKAKLVKGKNTILMKVRQDEAVQPWTEGWWYRLRVCTPYGAALTSTDRK